MKRAAAATMLAACALAARAELARMAAPAPHAGAIAGCTEVQAAFTPGDDIAGLIAGRIGRARHDVRVQAYLFTDPRIARALFAALRRGVEVQIVADAEQHRTGGLPWLEGLRKAGARVYLNAAVAAAHNKIVIVDGEDPEAAVITGSYNYTRAARSRNAENVVVLAGNPELAARYVANFRWLRDQSIPWR